MSVVQDSSLAHAATDEKSRESTVQRGNVGIGRDGASTAVATNQLVVPEAKDGSTNDIGGCVQNRHFLSLEPYAAGRIR